MFVFALFGDDASGGDEARRHDSHSFLQAWPEMGRTPFAGLRRGLLPFEPPLWFIHRFLQRDERHQV